MILGAHESTAGGMDGAIDRALADGAEAFQVFATSSRQWLPRALPGDDVRLFRQRVKESGLGPNAAHASYLINLASSSAVIRKKSVVALAEEVRRCAALGIPYVVLHPGSHGGDGEPEGVARVARGIDLALSGAERGVTILLENTAGQGDCVGHEFAHLRDIIGASRRSRRLGICFDTQHAFAAGNDLRTAEGYDATFAAVARTVGLRRLRAFHLNDSKRELGARVDRHENVGRGFLGLEPFQRLVNDPRFTRIPGYLETPPLAGKESFRRNLAILRSLAGTRGESRSRH
ncbi:MAG: deoxyribonuclease IV [Acidobacteriota bacterium]